MVVEKHMNHQQTHVPTKPLTFHAGWQNDIGDEFSPLQVRAFFGYSSSTTSTPFSP